jgi:hypothetical protein
MQYNGVVDAVRRMLADEGIAGFYKGELQYRPSLALLCAVCMGSVIVGTA